MNNLLSLPSDRMLANLAGLFVCVIIMFVCVCRLNLSRTRRWRLTMMQVMLISFAFWAAGTFGDLWQGHEIGFHGAAGGLGIIAYLMMSYRHWRLPAALWRQADDSPAFAETRPAWWSEEDEHATALHR